ncbi:unnamed protein product, partial [Meganyctiphanes norvegica]
GKVELPNSRMYGKNVTVPEFYSFLAMVILMGIVKKKKAADYWSEDPIILTPFFSKVMSKNRWQYIMSSLHFFDTLDPANVSNIDKMRRIRLVFDYLRRKFTSNFRPYRDLVIDESIVLWRG